MYDFNDIAQSKEFIALLKKELRNNNVPSKTLTSITTKALRTGRKLTGQWATNRDPRWSVDPAHPQYGTEVDCYKILGILLSQIFCFDNAPELTDELLDNAESLLNRQSSRELSKILCF